MKKLMALSTAFFMMMGISAFAGPPTGNAKPQQVQAGKHPKKDKAEKKVKKDKKDRGTATGSQHGKRKGWFKNTHNPHNANSNNPGHAQQHANGHH